MVRGWCVKLANGLRSVSAALGCVAGDVGDGTSVVTGGICLFHVQSATVDHAARLS